MARFTYRSFASLLLFLFVLAAMNICALAQSDQGLEISLSQLQDHSSAPIFEVELRNTGINSLVLNIGIMLANAKKQYPTEIRLELVDEDGRSTPLELIGPAYVAGRIDPLVVPLPRGAAFMLRVNLTDYISPTTKLRHLTLKPGHYTLIARYTGTAVTDRQTNLDTKGIALMPYWTGTVKSKAVGFSVPTKSNANKAR